jgi:hypothetical protein
MKLVLDSIGPQSDRRKLHGGRSPLELANFTHENITVDLWHFDIISIATGFDIKQG